jgi:hypothetical protein
MSLIILVALSTLQDDEAPLTAATPGVATSSASTAAVATAPLTAAYTTSADANAIAAASTESVSATANYTHDHHHVAQRWAGSGGEIIYFRIRESKCLWSCSCPIDAALVTLACAAGHSPILRDKMEEYDPQVAAYGDELWTSSTRPGCFNKLRQDLRYDAVAGLLHRELENRRSAGVEGLRFTKNEVNTYGSIEPWLNLGIRSSPLTGMKLYERFTCTSCILGTICQQTNISATDRVHNRYQRRTYVVVPAGKVHHERPCNLTNSWRILFDSRLCGKKLGAESNLEEDTHEANLTTIAVTETVHRLVSTNDALLLQASNDLAGSPRGVVYEATKSPPYFTCAASTTNDTTIEAFPPLIILNMEQCGEGQQHWVEQLSEVTLRAPLKNGIRTSMTYKLVAIIQQQPAHWTVSFFDHRVQTWFFHDGMKNNGCAQRCKSQRESIQDTAISFRVVYVQI